MILSMFPYIIAAWIFFCGLYGIVRSRHLIGTVISLAIMQTSTYVMLLAIGFRKGGYAPVLVGIPVDVPTVDPIVQALMLTDIVVEATVVALLLAMVVKAHEKAGTVSPDDLRFLRG